MKCSMKPALLLIAAFLSPIASSQSLLSPPPVPVVGPPAASVQPSCSTGRPGTLSVAGRGRVEAVADVATVTLAISITNATADGAREVAAGFANNVITSVQQVNGVYPDNVTTTSVSVYPKTQYNPSNGTSTNQGYTFTNRLQIGLNNLSSDLLSRVLDTAVKNGGNNLTISSVTFSLSPALSYNKTVAARTEAAADAKATAQQYAEGFGVKLGPLLSVADTTSLSSTYQYQSTETQSMRAVSNPGLASDSSTPVSIGKQVVYAAVAVAYTVCDSTAA